MNDQSGTAGEFTDTYLAQQRIIVTVLERWAGRPKSEVMDALRAEFSVRGVACPPGPWLDAVAAEINHDRLYVVANGMVPRDYFDNSSGQRAVARTRLPEHTLQPSEEASGSVEATHRTPGDRGS